MKQKDTGSILEHFSILPDPRRVNHNTKRHNLIDIVIITVLAVICGADDWPTIVAFGKKKEAWLTQFLELPYGIPSHDTFGRVFSLLDPKAFGQCFFGWVAAVNHLTDGEVVAIDGKTIRRSYDKDIDPLHVVTAFATANGVALSQRVTDVKSNEITAIPKLLKTLHLSGCIVTIDAIGCQKKIAKTILQRGADYVLAVKGNQKTIHQDLKYLFREDIVCQYEGDVCETIETNASRREVRRCRMITDSRLLPRGEYHRYDWPGLTSLAQVISERTVRGKTTTETRYYISSLSGSAEEILSAARSHWQIENSLHWVLDIAFREDESRVRIGHAQENLSAVRKLALTLLRQEPSGQGGIKSRRLQAGWDDEYLLAVVGIRP
jgi:predicted transposase YbfD/YdcC